MNVSNQLLYIPRSYKLLVSQHSTLYEAQSIRTRVICLEANPGSASANGNDVLARRINVVDRPSVLNDIEGMLEVRNMLKNARKPRVYQPTP